MKNFFEIISSCKVLKDKIDYSLEEELFNRFEYFIEENEKEIIFNENLFPQKENLSEIIFSKIYPILDYCHSTQKDFKIPLEGLQDKKVSLLKKKLKDENPTLKKGFLVIKPKEKETIDLNLL